MPQFSLTASYFVPLRTFSAPLPMETQLYSRIEVASVGT